MSTIVTPPPAVREEISQEETRRQVSRILAKSLPQGDRFERRQDGRYPYPYLVSLVPVGPDGLHGEGPALTVVGKQISHCGLGFYHNQPLPYRRMIATFESAGRGKLSLLIDITWCRFLRQGWYESGGRFLQVVSG